MTFHLTRYEPWSLHRAFIHECNRMLERNGAGDESTSATAEWAPAVDIEEHADRYVLRADVPGVDPNAIEITLEKGVLTLSGSRERAVEQNGVESRRTERLTGRFLRRFTLPESVDAENVKASGKHGVLEIVIPKREAAKPRKISVNS
ncbi:MAG: Hsp20/alpha crystallin family protein [Gammaproteobacteria bacterium]